MADKRFNDEWEALPEVYKSRFVEILEERGLAKDFDLLPDEHKAQILEIVKEVIRQMTDTPSEDPPGTQPPEI